MTLPLRITPHRGEPAHAVLMRLARRHGEDEVSAFAQQVGVAWRGPIANVAPRSVAELIAFDVEALQHFSPSVQPAARVVEIAAQRLYLNDWTISRRRFCPACYHQDRADARAAKQPETLGPWHRTYWDISSYDSCHTHHYTLADACSACGSAATWAHSAIDLCSQCGHDLTKVPMVRASGEVAAYIAGRLGLNDWTPCPILDAQSLGEALSICERLGFAVTLQFATRRSRAQRQERADARRAGLAAACLWPDAFHKALDLLVKRERCSTDPAGMIGTYGWVYSAWACTEATEPFGSDLRHRLREHALENGIAQHGEALFGQRNAQGHGVTEAARRLGISVRRLSREVVASGVALAGRRPGVATALPDTWVDQIADDIRTTLDMQGVANALGIGRSRAREIIALDLIPPVTVMGARRFRQSDVAALLMSLRETQGRSSSSPPPSRLLTLPRACQRAGVPIAQAIDALRERRLSLTSIDDNAIGLQALIVDTNEVRLLRPREGKLSVEEAARRLSVHPDTVRYLIRIGALQRTDRKSLMIDEKSLHQSQKDLVACTILSRQLQRSSRAIMRHASRLGVRACHGPPACRNILFDRRSAAFILASWSETRQ